MKIKVESVPDAKGQETPSRFLLGTRTINVEQWWIVGTVSRLATTAS